MLFFKPKKAPVKGAVVLITGAGSGIGRLMALGAARRGAKAVVVWDLNGEAAEQTAAEISEMALGEAGSGRQIRASAYTVDVTNEDAVVAAAREVLDEYGRVDILINNAGIVTGKPFLETTGAEVQRSFEVNTISHYRMVRQFLPGMIARDRGSVVTIASAAGLVGVPRQSDYNGSKFGAVGFAQSLRQELRHMGSRVHTLLYCPYYISTGMFEGVKTKFPLVLPILTPEQVARQVLDAIEKGTQFKVHPPIVRLVQILQAFPVPFMDAIVEFFGVADTMDDFTGRK
ncbi:MAG: SDR family oxidoreductase [Mobiluncus porci]|uniref:SDR family oxidoreductase n=1 Tax=Mobiluncus porci TaxID=2652278 RepID=A0A7K0K0M4_9ACTO|nr:MULTISPECIES: SDR family oxidoreductase [Mobiluncus]MCI6585157.1 SDR family oxidoreductase [Mobiluncus sp.]MDD7540595.1 SDR family oxidoreductase [Mobiluncus porci]MDY5748720.1 SDR family oxidoreductase [Mobiluncus porci]MST49031.1 SDR family oxidoreductase [Mobiluncus porci]